MARTSRAGPRTSEPRSARRRSASSSSSSTSSPRSPPGGRTSRSRWSCGAKTGGPGRELLDRVGLGDRGHHYPAQLSGGEQERWRWPGPSSTTPGSSSPTSPPETSTPPTGPTWWAWSRIASWATTLVLVTHCTGARGPGPPRSAPPGWAPDRLRLRARGPGGGRAGAPMTTPFASSSPWPGGKDEPRDAGGCPDRGGGHRRRGPRGHQLLHRGRLAAGRKLGRSWGADLVVSSYQVFGEELLEELRQSAAPPPGATVARTITFGAMARVPEGGATVVRGARRRSGYPFSRDRSRPPPPPRGGGTASGRPVTPSPTRLCPSSSASR